MFACINAYSGLVVATESHSRLDELVFVQGGSVLATYEQHLTNPLQMCREIVIEEEDVNDHLDTIFHSLECHVTAEAVGVTGGCKAHGSSVVRESAVRGYEGREVPITLVKLQLPVAAQDVHCCEVMI